MGKNQHVVRRGNMWGVLPAGNSHITSKHVTQSAAETAAIRVAKKGGSEVIVHGRDGKIRSKDSYGKDPCPPRDKEH